MKLLPLLAFLLLSLTSTASATEIRDFINNRNCDQVLDKRFYQICYDYHAKGARYVGYTLSGNNVDKGNIKKRPRFYPDRAIPARYRTTSSDYTRNEFHSDRGHLAPDASFDYSPQALKSVYSMANIIPQYKWINRRTWVKAEKYERQVARKLGSISVLNGVIYTADPKRLRKSGIAYPDAYWKMLYNNHGFERCFYYKNNSYAAIKGDKLRDHVIDCKTVTRHRSGPWSPVAAKTPVSAGKS
ncbi:MAG: DNA/RNA non-specific endonuclease [Mariprofundus sp.]